MLTDEELNILPYSLSKKEKNDFLNKQLISLTKHHFENCPEYKKILDSLSFDVNKIHDYTQIPFLPVRLFKQYELRSVEKADVVKTLTSSGTTGKFQKSFLISRLHPCSQRLLQK